MVSRIFWLCTILALGAHGSALAALMDLDAPSWRTTPPGSATTTMQGWSFSTNANPAVADALHNNFGTPTLTIDNGGYPLGTAWFSTYAGATGVWSFTAVGAINVYIPNTGNNAPDTWKEINLQIVYKDGGGTGDEIPLLTDPQLESTVRTRHQEIGTNGYFLDTYKIVIRPNPPGEEVLAFTMQCKLFVDEIVIDTICLPEPATMAILALGGLMLQRRK